MEEEEACLPLRPLPTLVVGFWVEWRLSAPTSRFQLRGDRRQGTPCQLIHHPNPPHSATPAPSQVGPWEFAVFHFTFVAALSYISVWALTCCPSISFSCLLAPVLFPFPFSVVVVVILHVDVLMLLVILWLLFCHLLMLWWWWLLLPFFCDVVMMSSWWRWCCACRCCFGGCYCDCGCGRAEEERSGVRNPPSQWKVSDLDIVLSEPTDTWEGRRSPQGGDSKNSESLKALELTY